MFTALLPPAGVRRELDELLRPRRKTDRLIRYTSQERWHVTLSFMPAVGPASEETLVGLLHEIASGTAGFPVALGQADGFPNARRAKVLYLGVTEGRGEVVALSSACREAAGRAGTGADQRESVPHLTIARVRYHPIDARTWRDELHPLPLLRWHVGSFALVASNMGDGPERYEVVAEFPLRG
ncbi:RNA 2',3'-cyclic phosphodiesterase [Brevibacterium daeguense]|uniref:RNA 2',3'-cyclic phosphodiesterase n=2 Tax=Brevibacterium daeguense TaxID=909936 RepID=A0ABP8EK24_9MICO